MRKGIKKLLTVALTATLGLAALAGCGTGTSSNGDGSANGGTTKELSGKIQLAGSTSMEKMCGALMEAFMEEYPNVTVERYVNGKWGYYTSWIETNYNSVYVGTSKTLSVPTGYYYRVCCVHYANSDVSDSFTNGIYI